MKRVAEFKKVSYEQFKKDILDILENDEYTDVDIKKIYCGISIPKRATSGSAGYDFVLPVDLELYPGEEIKIPTGIKCNMVNSFVLQCYPRSGLGFKYRLQLNNTVGIIDSDYSYSDNEGHIMAKLYNNGNKIIKLNAGDKFMQGIFVEYGITYDDDVKTTRNGGFGSTGK